MFSEAEGRNDDGNLKNRSSFDIERGFLKVVASFLFLVANLSFLIKIITQLTQQK